MNTKIKVPPCAKDDYSCCYVMYQPSGRKIVKFYHKNKPSFTVSYAKYLLMIKLNRYLSKYEEVDHIDGDFTNDCLSNLQILTPEQHREKTINQLHGGRHLCPNCGKKRIKRRKTCSLECSLLLGFSKKSKKPSKDELESKIYTLKNFLQLGRFYGVSDNAVRKWCKYYGLPFRTSELKKRQKS